MALTDKLTAIADAIRAKTGTTGTMTLAEMPEKIAAIQTGGGGTSQIDSLIDRTITEISNDSVTSIGAWAFQNCSILNTANFPAVTSIGSHAFNSCSKLTTVNFPVTTSISDYAFSTCTELTTADFPVVTSIDIYAFYSCYKLTTVNFPLATSIGNDAFYGCSQLTTVNFPVVTSIGEYAFQNCTRLTTADFPLATSIGKNAFYLCRPLKALILRSETMATLDNTNAFSNTLIASGTGYIYVPAVLVDSYKTATNWSVYANQIRAIEDYPDITGGAA